MDNRTEFRQQIIGDICWSYASDTEENKGIMVEESKSGMSIVTYGPVKVGSIVRVDCRGSWQGTRYLLVKWCRQVAPDNYRCGLSVIKHY